MKNIKKIAAIVLAIAMCFTVFAVSAESEKTVKLVAQYSKDAKSVEVFVITTEKMGAIRATFNSDVKFTDRQIELYDEGEGVEKADQFKLVNNGESNGSSATFVLVTKDPAGEGDNTWAKFTFPIETTKDTAYNFTLTGVEICTVDEELTNVDNVDPVSITFNLADALQSLGIQYRPAEVDVSDAIRYGAKLIRDKANSKITVESKEYQAIWCGYIHGWSDMIKTTSDDAWSNQDLTLSVNAENGKMTKDFKCKVLLSKNALENEANYLVYTLALENMSGLAANVQAIDYVVRPFTVYRDNTNGKYGIVYGKQMVESYADIVAAGENLPTATN